MPAEPLPVARHATTRLAGRCRSGLAGHGRLLGRGERTKSPVRAAYKLLPDGGSSDRLLETSQLSANIAHFRAIYEGHMNFVQRSLRKLGVREADTPDTSQKVFVAAFSKLPEFEGRSKVSSWLFGICRRIAADYRKSAAFRFEVSVDSRILDTYLCGDDPLVSRDLCNAAERALHRLPPEQQEIYLLHEVEQLTGPEIARRLGLPIGTVRSRLRLARSGLARRLNRVRAAQAA